MSYCEFVKNLPTGERKTLHANYHDNHYGKWIDDDNKLFGRLILEINQAGLSWETILKKQKAFEEAYRDFDINTVANFNQDDVKKLLSNSGIIRNKLKINAVIYNANVIKQLQQEYKSFAQWILSNHPKEKFEWVKLFKKKFKFTGNEITGEFLMSIGILNGAHDENCVEGDKLTLQKKLIWLNKKEEIYLQLGKL